MVGPGREEIYLKVNYFLNKFLLMREIKSEKPITSQYLNITGF